jgi:hypothetical protein
MTVLVQGDLISIRNSSGATKFDSNNKLVYQKATQIGTVSLNSSSSSLSLPFTTLEQNDFSVITIKINSSSGQASLVAGILNQEIPANGGVVIDFFGRNVNNQAAVDSELLGVDLVAGSIFFRAYRLTNTGDLLPGQTSINLQYTARIWSFL